MPKPKKKVLLMVVDACASRVMIPALQNGKLPNLKALVDAGTLYPECIAVFPSLTPAATSSILTGLYPRQHGIMGFHWYDLDKNEVVYYGDDFWTVIKRGIGEFFEDFLFKLNHERLQSQTLFEIVEESGLKAACLNYLMFRGKNKHKANVPLLLSLLPGVPFTGELYGPSLMYFGDLVNSKVETVGEILSTEGGMLNRFGFNDDNTIKLLVQLAEERAFPEFSIAYFPDNDFNSHKLGPEAAVTTLEHLDERLGEFITAYGGLETLLSEICIILTGDHSQSDMLTEKEDVAIRLDELLDDFFNISETGKPWRESDQLVLCPDMRSAQIYFKSLTPGQLEQVIALLMADSRVDQLIWRAEYLGDEHHGCYIATLDRGRLRFWPGSDGPNTGRDPYGCVWSWEGDLRAVDGLVSTDKQLTFPTYPNAFERIFGALNGQNGGHLWVTAHPGHEFSVAETSLHLDGGSHGSLHALDSTSPLLIAGAPPDLQGLVRPRSVDIAPLCLSLLELEPFRPVGTSLITKEDL